MKLELKTTAELNADLKTAKDPERTDILSELQRRWDDTTVMRTNGYTLLRVDLSLQLGSASA